MSIKRLKRGGHIARAQQVSTVISQVHVCAASSRKPPGCSAHCGLSLRGISLPSDPVALSSIWLPWAGLCQFLVGLKSLGRAMGVSASAWQCPCASWVPHRPSEDEQASFKQDSPTSWSRQTAVPGPDDITDFLTLQSKPGKLTREM